MRWPTISATGRFVLDDRFEDGHSAIEARLIERLGDAGRKVHTGRSRNDQVLVATRLWLKAQAASNCQRLLPSGRRRLPRARRARSACRCRATRICSAPWSPRRRMWFAGFAEAFIDNAVARARHPRAGSMPTRSARPPATASTCALDREHTTRRLGFARMQISPGLRPAFARQVRDRCTRRTGQRRARPAPAGLGPVPVHHGRIRLRRLAGRSTRPAVRSCRTSAIPMSSN